MSSNQSVPPHAVEATPSASTSFGSGRVAVHELNIAALKNAKAIGMVE
jgi:hypothetical protein